MVERDDQGFLEELRAGWKHVQPPDLPEEREELDPETRRAVEWMRAAWSEVEVPAVRLPRRRRLRLLPRLAHPLTIGLAAAAAAVLLLLLRSSDLENDLDHTEELVARETPVEDATGTNPEPESPVVITAVGENNIELRSGPVTLVLVTSESGG